MMTQTTGKLFVLEASGDGRLFSINPDGSDKTYLVTGCPVPDGVAVDVEAGHIYWTNMGMPPANDGSIERVDLDGGNRTTIVPSGGTYTPKQLHFDTIDRKLYWGDREGMRVMRCDLDGTNIETLVQTGQGDDDRHDETNWCVGVAVDHVGGHLYWTQKGPSDAGLGRILRAGIDVPTGDSAAHRSDIEVVFKDLPEPIDLEIEHTTRMLYWTDRGDPPNGNTVNRAPLDIIYYAEPEIVATHLMEGIGIALDPAHNRMFVTDLGGNIYVAALDGSGHRPIRALHAQGEYWFHLQPGMGSGETGVSRGRSRRRVHTAGSRPDVRNQHRFRRRPLPDDGSGRLGRRVGYRRALLRRAPGVPRRSPPAVTYLPAARPVGDQVRRGLLRRIPTSDRPTNRRVTPAATTAEVQPIPMTL